MKAISKINKTASNILKAIAAISVLMLTLSKMGFGMTESAPSVKIEWVATTCPTASFSVSNNGATVGTPIVFVNQSVDADSYHWDFGDGNFSTADNPSHAYAAPGTYTVVLKAIINGCEHSFIGIVETVMG